MQDLKGRAGAEGKTKGSPKKDKTNAVIEARWLDAQFQLMAGQLHPLANHILAQANE